MNDLLHGQKTGSTGPVECLGQPFPSEHARREHFTKLLAEKLKDPAFRKIEGFPQGTDEAILAMSDPPYYTACPNPFLEDFVRHYGKPYDPSVKYSREPQTIDVSVGKTDPLYKAHSYHTKVPHLAIVPSILHYTEPGDIVLDGFGGSGMTGVAAQWCGSAPSAYRHELETEWKKQGKAAPKWGSRRVILNDLSPAATFIAANYNLPFDIEAFAKAGQALLKEVEREIGWMYETIHTDGKTKGLIEYTVWSQIYTCPECTGEVNFLDEALDEESKRVRESFPCPHCATELTKQRMERLFVSQIDPATGEAIKTPKRKPVLISYRVGKSRHEKSPDKGDLDVLEKIEKMGIPSDLPTMVLPTMHMTHERARMDYSGITHMHHFFLPRAAFAMSLLWRKAIEVPSQIHSYLSSNHKDQRGLDKSDPVLVAKAKDRWYVPDPNKAQDLEKKREKALLKEFETYKVFTGRKIKESRLEVLRAGFRAAWAAKDYQTIIGIANKLPEETLQEDEKLLTLYDLALTRTEDGL